MLVLLVLFVVEVIRLANPQTNIYSVLRTDICFSANSRRKKRKSEEHSGSAENNFGVKICYIFSHLSLACGAKRVDIILKQGRVRM